MEVSLRVLIVEDSEADALLILHELQRGGFDIFFERAETAEAYVKALERKEWDFIICDYKMPSFTGLAALGVLQEKKLDIPFILISGTVGEETAVEAMKAGAQDYILKDKLVRLVPAVKRELNECRVRKEHKRFSEMFGRFFKLSQDLCCIAGFDGYFKTLNPSWERVLGWTLQELLSKPYLEFVHAEDREKTLKAADEATAGKVFSNFENRYLCKGGGYKWLSWSTSSFIKEKVSFASARDITDLKRFDEELKASNEKLQTILDSSPLAVVILDNERRVQFWNPASERLFGWSAVEAAGHPIPIIPKDRLEEFLDNHKKVSAGEEIVGKEVPVQKKDGTVIDMNIAVAPLRDAKGIIIGSVGFLMDVSGNKLADKQIKGKMEEIEKLNRFMIGREKRIIELKKEVDEVLKECGKPLKYRV